MASQWASQLCQSMVEMTLEPVFNLWALTLLLIAVFSRSSHPLVVKEEGHHHLQIFEFGLVSFYNH